LLLLVLSMANSLSQTFSLCDRCLFLHNSAPLDNTVILTGERSFVKGKRSLYQGNHI
jgi:hypothetical protein